MKLELILNYDFDPEEGYTQKSITLDTNEVAMYEDLLAHKKKLIVNLYEEDIENLVEGTGIKINGN